MRGQESNLRTRGSKPRISTSRNYPAIKEGRVGLEPTRGCLTNTCSAAELPTQKYEDECGPTASSLSLGGKPCFQPDDFHSSSCGDRNRTCVVTVNSRLPVPARTPPQEFSVSVVGFEPTISCPRGTRPSFIAKKGQAFPHADNRSSQTCLNSYPNCQ